MTNQKRYFVDNSDGFYLYDTEKEALEAANEEIAMWRKEARYDGEWPEEVENITYGVILGRSAPIEHDDDGQIGYDYQMMKIEGESK